MIKHFKIILLLGLFFALPSYSAKLAASCSLMDGLGREIQGLNPDLLHEIASVSKVFTSLWALEKMGPTGRFVTKIYVQRLGDSSVANVHLEGARDPYTGTYMLYFLMSELQRLGLTEIRQLTFDENFKFLIDPQANQVAVGRYGLSSPSADSVQSQISKTLKQIAVNYESFRKQMEKFANISIEARVRIKVNDVQFVSTSEKESLFKNTRVETYLYRSSILLRILKEMNRNSNNHSANQIFEALGGASEFHNFMSENFGLDQKSVSFVNGSGDRLESISSGSPYNRATCRTILKVVSRLDQQLKNRGLSLDKVLSVVGDGTISNVGRLYDAPETQLSVVAKTGTVDPAITLAGRVSTQNGQVYFGYIMKTVGDANDWRSARAKIREQLISLIREHRGARPISTSSRPFLGFDAESKLEKVETLAMP